MKAIPVTDCKNGHPYVALIAEKPLEVLAIQALAEKYACLDMNGLEAGLKVYEIAESVAIRLPLTSLKPGQQADGTFVVPKERVVEGRTCLACEGGGYVFTPSGGTTKCPDCGGSGKLSWKGGPE